MTLLTFPASLRSEKSKQAKPNILLFTADDLHCNSLECFGGKVQGLTPNLNHFASEGMRFKRAHVTVAICAPSRGVLASGLYGHNSGMMGFMKTEKNIPTVMEATRKTGYLTGILGKVSHSTPKEDYQWDFEHDYRELGAGRNPEKYYNYCKEFFETCRQANKPFYFMVNSHDPHRPFHIPGKPLKGASEPTRTYSPEDITVPVFLPDLPDVRKELSYYYNSVRRCDDTFGKTMQALKESSFADNTLVMFLSDNGLAVPFAKANVYLNSTLTPWIVRWPKIVKPDSIDTENFISGIDFFPTVLEAIGQPNPGGLDGTSFIPLLKGQKQQGRDKVFTQIDWKIGGRATPMRCIQTAQFGYIYNAWSNGEFAYRNNNEGMTMNAMNEAAKTDSDVAERINMYRYRVPEELYELEKDPGCLHNLIDNPSNNNVLNEMRKELQGWMEKTNDPLLEAYLKRESTDEFEAAYNKAFATKPGKKRAKKKKTSKTQPLFQGNIK